MPHWEIGAQLGVLDMERGSKLSGSMIKFGATVKLVDEETDEANDRRQGAVRPG